MYIDKEGNNCHKFKHLKVPPFKDDASRLQNQCTVVKQVVNKGLYKMCAAILLHVAIFKSHSRLNVLT